MSSSGCILRCRVAGLFLGVVLRLYYEVSCSWVYFEVSSSVHILRCRVAGSFVGVV